MNPVRFGGGERLMLDLGDYCRSEHIDFRVMNLNRSTEFEEKLIAHHAPFESLGTIYLPQTPSKAEYVILLIRSLKNIPAVARAISSERPDHILANGFPTIALVAGALWFTKERPKMIYVHHFMKAREHWLIGWAYQWILNRYDKIVAVSSLTRDTLIENFPALKEKITFVPNGIDCGRFVIASDKAELRKKLGLPNGILAFCVGRLAAFKNQKVLIDLASRIQDDRFHILIAGDGSEYENLTRMIGDKKLEHRVKLLGGIDSENLPEYLGTADMFLFPSLKEGFGIAVTEAMAAGLPVVILKNIYIKEFGEHLLVARDMSEFERMTKQLAEDPVLRGEIGTKARRYVVDHLDISVTGKKFIETIQ